MSEPRKMKVQRIDLDLGSTIRGTAAEITTNLKEIEKKYGKGVFELREYFETVDFLYQYQRLETDKEMAARIKRREAHRKSVATKKAKKDAAELLEFERLKKKYNT